MCGDASQHRRVGEEKNGYCKPLVLFKKRLTQVGYLDITACNIMIMILDLVILTGYASVSSYLTFVLLDDTSMSLGPL